MGYSLISDPNCIASYVKGNGIRRLCANGEDISLDEAIRRIQEIDSSYVEVSEDGNKLGLVIFTPTGEHDGVFSIHLCLRSRGEKTFRAVTGAIEYARRNCGARFLIAAIPDGRESCHKLSEDIGFEFLTRKDGFTIKTLKLK